MIIIFYISLAGLLTIVLAAHNQYHVHPDDTPCLQPPCHTLEYFTNNSDVYFMSDTTLLFDKGEYYHIIGNLTIQNVTNISLIGTPYFSNPTSPVSVIKCLPDHSIYFYNVTTLLIKYLKLKDCGSLMPVFKEYGMPFWAAMFFYYCTNITISNMYIYNPVGYGVLALNVMGSSNCILKVTIMLGRKEEYGGVICSKGGYLGYKDMHNSTTKIEEIFFNIDNIALKGGCEFCECYSEERMLEIDLQSYIVYINISNSNFTDWNDSKKIQINIHSSSPVMIIF